MKAAPFHGYVELIERHVLGDGNDGHGGIPIAGGHARWPNSSMVTSRASIDKSTATPSLDSSQHDHSGNLLSDALGWTSDNIGKPIANAALINPWNAIASTTNGLTGHSKDNPLLPEIGTFDVPKANFLSVNWFAQGLSGGLGMIAPYVIAGRATGGAMRWSGDALGVEGRTAELFKDARVAQIAGAGIYDGMRSPGQGETRLGNALSGVAGFTVFEYGNAFGKTHFNFTSNIAKRGVVGFAGATAQQTVSHLVSEHRLPTTDEYIQSGISGSVLNIALPPTQDAIMRSVDSINHSLGRGVPIEHYLATHKELSTTSDTLHNLIFKNPWARIQDRAAQDAVDLPHKIVQLTGAHPDPARLGHELSHLQQAHANETKAAYDQAANLLKAGNIADAKALFFQTHLSSEVHARVTENKIGEELGTQPHHNVDDIARIVPNVESHQGISYAQDSEAAFHQFVESGGKVRPSIEYGGTYALPPANPKIPKPALLLARGEGEGDIWDNGNGTVTKIYYDKAVDAGQKRAIYDRLEKMGVTVPKIFDHGTTPDGQPALVIEKVGDGDNLKWQLISGELTAADRESIRKQYYAMGDTLEANGVSVDWNLGNMRYENGKLYLLDPSFLKEQPISRAFVDMFGRSFGPR